MTEPVSGTAYLIKLEKFLKSHSARLAPRPAPRPSVWQRGYAVLSLGLDGPSPAPARQRPLLLRMPPDKLLYLLLRWQALSHSHALPHVGRTDTPIPHSVVVPAMQGDGEIQQGDVTSVRSWAGSIRTVSGSLVGAASGGRWWSSGKTVSDDELLLSLYSMFTLIPALLVHPPNASEAPIAELAQVGGYTSLGGIDVRVPLDVLRNLQILELESYDPRALLIPKNLGLRSLTVRHVQDGDDWIYELLVASPPSPDSSENSPPLDPRFPNLRHLSLIHTSLLNFPSLPLTSLTHLDLSHNLLDCIPSSLGDMHSLTSLNLSHNVITSVRNAYACLGQVVSINLSHNRIDCLVGLDKVLGLERVDIRSNHLYDSGEVGRLALLPRISEIYCSSNPFEKQPVPEGGEPWRVELGIAFREEGRSVVFDGVEWTWNEERKIEGGLVSRGRTRPARHTRSVSHSEVHRNSPLSASQSAHSRSATDHHATHPPSPSLPNQPPRNGHYNPGFPPHGHSHLRETSAVSDSPGGKSAKGKKRGKRRVINLDGAEEQVGEGTMLGDRLEGGLAERVVGDGNGNGQSHEDDLEKEAPVAATAVKVIKKKKSRKPRDPSSSSFAVGA